MKAKLSVAVFCVLASVACAEQPSPLTGEQQYRAFKEALTDDRQTVRYEDYLSSFLMSMLESSGSAEERAQLETQSSFPLWLKVEESFYEKTTDSGRCLTVTGEAQDSSPGMVLISYVVEDEMLKADEIHYQYLETIDDFPSSAICPHEFGLDFPS